MAIAPPHFFGYSSLSYYKSNVRMNLGAVLLNDFTLMEARLAGMRERKLISCCPKCMQSEESSSACPLCRPRSNFPSAFSSQAEWDTD